MGRYYNDFNDIRGSDELFHYGVQGMKWGIRRYVNYDGTLTAEGRRKYGTYQNFARSPEGQKMISQAKGQQTSTPRYTKIQNGVQTQQSSQQPKKGLSTKQKVAIGATVTAGVVAATGTAIAIHNHHNMMEYESALGNTAMQNMSAKWRDMSVSDKAKAIISNAKTSWHDRDGMVLDEGTNFHRMEVGSHAIDPRKVNRGIYVTYKPSDYVKYKSDFVTDRLNKARKEADYALKNGDIKKFNDIYGNTKVTERIMSANKKVVIPSTYDSKKIFYEEVYGKNKAAVGNLLKQEFAMPSKKSSSRYDKNNAKIYAECQKLMSKDKLNNGEQQRLYELFNKALGVGVRNDKLSEVTKADHMNLGSTKYFNALEKHGFGALKDVNDRKLGFYNSKSPLIILDRNHTMQDAGKDVVRNIGWDEYKLARVKARVGPDAAKKTIGAIPRGITGRGGNSEGLINFGHDSKQSKIAENLYNRTSRLETKLGGGLTAQQHFKAEGLSKQLGTSTNSVLSSIRRKMSEGNMSFDEALNSYKENVKDRVKPNTVQKVTEAVGKSERTGTNSILNEVKTYKQNLAPAIKSQEYKTGETNINDLLAQLSQNSKGGTGKGASFKKAAQSVDDLTAELLKSNRRHLS